MRVCLPKMTILRYLISFGLPCCCRYRPQIWLISHSSSLLCRRITNKTILILSPARSKNLESQSRKHVRANAIENPLQNTRKLSTHKFFFTLHLSFLQPPPRLLFAAWYDQQTT